MNEEQSGVKAAETAERQTAGGGGGGGSVFVLLSNIVDRPVFTLAPDCDLSI